MVFNNTKVIQARLHFKKETGATIEVFCMEPFAPAEYQQNFAEKGSVEWLCMIGNLKRWKEGRLTRQVDVNGQSITFCVPMLADNVKTFTVKGKHGNTVVIDKNATLDTPKDIERNKMYLIPVINL